jgi:hypothetical protein
MNAIARPSKLYDAMAVRWELINTLLGGTEAMRREGTKYLPREQKESTDAYNIRLNRTFLFPALERTIGSLSGQVFRKEIRLGNDVPGEIEAWKENINLQGQNLDVFAKDVLESALADGITHIHVDFPSMPTGLTLAEERIIGARPYFRHVKAQELIFWWSANVGGREVLTELRLKEDVRGIAEDGTEIFTEQIRILRIGEYEIWQKQKDDKWLQTTPPTKTSFLNGIPFVTIYAGRQGFMMAKPPLMGLAWLNLAHWQSSSDQRNILRIARVPMLFGAGWELEKGASVTLGSNRMIAVAEPQATLNYVEHTGAAIEAGRQDLIDLKEEMAAMGTDLLVRRPGGELATNRAIAKVEADSWLASLAKALQDGLEEGFEYMAKWANLKSGGGSVEVNTDFGLTEADTNALNALIAARTARDISREAFLNELKRYKVLSEDFDIEAELVKMETEEDVEPDIEIEDDEVIEQ